MRGRYRAIPWPNRPAEWLPAIASGLGDIRRAEGTLRLATRLFPIVQRDPDDQNRGERPEENDCAPLFADQRLTFEFALEPGIPEGWRFHRARWRWRKKAFMVLP